MRQAYQFLFKWFSFLDPNEITYTITLFSLCLSIFSCSDDEPIKPSEPLFFPVAGEWRISRLDENQIYRHDSLTVFQLQDSLYGMVRWLSISTSKVSQIAGYIDEDGYSRIRTVEVNPEADTTFVGIFNTKGTKYFGALSFTEYRELFPGIFEPVSTVQTAMWERYY